MKTKNAKNVRITCPKSSARLDVLAFAWVFDSLSYIETSLSILYLEKLRGGGGKEI